MAALPDSKRPKNVQELKEFVQKYSSIINKPPPISSSSQSKATSTSPVPPFAPSSADNIPAKSRTQVAQPPPLSANEGSQTASVAEHFKNSLLASASRSSPISALQRGSHELPPQVPMFIPQFPTTAGPGGGTEEAKSDRTKLQPFGSSTMHAPVTTQFDPTSSSLAPPPPPAAASQTIPVSNPAAATSSSSGIQAGIATPLPPGLTLETLAVLCRLPEADLQKLKLPPALLSAIKVWKARQLPSKTKVSI